MPVPRLLTKTLRRPRTIPLIPSNSPLIGKRLGAADEVLRWKSSMASEIEGDPDHAARRGGQPPYKLLVMPHGGPHHRATSGSGFDVQFFATQGLLPVFQPNFRGSRDMATSSSMPTETTSAAATCRTFLAASTIWYARDCSTAKRQFVYGISYGGYITSWLIGQTHQFRAAVPKTP